MNSNGRFNFVLLALNDASVRSAVLYPAYQEGGIIDNIGEPASGEKIYSIGISLWTL